MELSQVTHLNLYNNNVTAIEGLGRFNNLLRLTLRSNNLKSLEGLEEAYNLR